MTRKTVQIERTVYDQLKKCKINNNEYTTKIIKRLLDKYEEELLNEKRQMGNI